MEDQTAVCIKREYATHEKFKREILQHMSTKIQQQIEWRRDKVM